MSLDFKLHYDRLREGDPTKPETAATTNEAGTFYEEPGHARNLCLVWIDGKRQFINYAYLVGGTFIPGGEKNEITLNFTAYQVKLSGYNLETIFIALLGHLPRQVVQTEARYMQAGDKTTGIVTNMEVTQN